ncbi:MAG: TAXI family TRAP transporter solute-binding subunit [Oligoflexia bacterium]|nr:TAXI family TRAP transporter solute-binding subunit [Oligoflexia bacterium]
MMKNGNFWGRLPLVIRYERIYLSLSLLLLLGLLLLVLLSSCEKKFVDVEPTIVAIGTGDVTGSYYQTGTIIGKIVEENTSKNNLKVAIESTDGSVANINSVLSGKFQFALAQSDRQYQAYKGLEEWKEAGPRKKLRSIISIYPESITIIATEASQIKEIKDIKGKKVGLGSTGSGVLANARDILKAYAINESDFEPLYVKPLEAFKLIREGGLDAFFYTIGHPSTNIKNLTMISNVKVRFISITGTERDQLCSKYPYYTDTVIAASTYPAALNERDITSIGVLATLVTSESVDEEIVYKFTKDLFSNLAKLKDSNSLYSNLSRERLFDGLSAPIHAGALKYFKEVDMLKYIDKNLIN